jgi:hypothetical protein
MQECLVNFIKPGIAKRLKPTNPSLQRFLIIAFVPIRKKSSHLFLKEHNSLISPICVCLKRKLLQFGYAQIASGTGAKQ